MKELVSLIVPIYKVEKYLERCIESIVTQSYENIEIILVDDGSPDRCPVICDEWAGKDSRIQVIHKKNGGLSDARNAGLKAASGNYVAFVDSDDYIHPQFVEILYYIMKQHNGDVAACEYKQVSEDSSPELVSDICCEDIQIKEISEVTPAAVGVQAWNKLYKKSLFDKIQFPVGKIHEDVGIWWEMAYYAERIVAIPEKLYFYCENPASIMRKSYTMKHMDLVDVLYMQYTRFKMLSEEDYAGKVLIECLNAYPGLYVRLNRGADFGSTEKKIFKEDYRQKIKIAKRDKNIPFMLTLKHVIYCYFPFTMLYMYKRHQKDKNVM